MQKFSHEIRSIKCLNLGMLNPKIIKIRHTRAEVVNVRVAGENPYLTIFTCFCRDYSKSFKSVSIKGVSEMICSLLVIMNFVFERCFIKRAWVENNKGANIPKSIGIHFGTIWTSFLTWGKCLSCILCSNSLGKIMVEMLKLSELKSKRITPNIPMGLDISLKITIWR